jgi:O-succinylbenzoate synthase
MKIDEISIYKYQLPFVQPVQIGNTQLSNRTGAILCVKTNTDLHGFGEAAPLPGLQKEPLKNVTKQLMEVKSSLIGIHIHEWFEVIDNLYMKEKLFPCVQFGIESALLNIIEQVKVSGQRLKLPEVGNNKIYVNILATGNKTTILRKVRKGLSENYRSIKVKVGRNSLEEDIELVRTIHKVIGNKVSLRLDANQAWEFEEAMTFANAVEDLAIEYIEEPLKNPEDLFILYKKTGLPIALDECLKEMSPDSFQSKGWVKVLILKPVVIGSVQKTLQYIDIGKRTGVKTVISDTFHTGVGLAFLIRLASIIDKPTPMGFDTYNWLDGDILVERLPVKDGCFDLKTAMNLCNKINFSKLEYVE